MALTDLALYTIETELAELLALREEMVAAGELPESIAATDKQIEAYCSAEVAKVDRIAGAIRACERNAEIAITEAERLRERGEAWRNRVAAIKEAALRAMQARGIKSLETPENKLTVCGNGGKEPLEIEGDKVPLRLCKTTLVMPAPLALRLIRDLSEAECRELYSNKTEFDNSAIRVALQRRESVPGARLKERRSHLKLS